MSNKINFCPDSIPFTDEELKRTTVLHGKEEIDAARKIRRAQYEHNRKITDIMNAACIKSYDSKIIPDDYNLPILTDVEAYDLVKLDPDINSVVLESKISIRRRVSTNWEIAQQMNKQARFERDNYDE